MRHLSTLALAVLCVAACRERRPLENAAAGVYRYGPPPTPVPRRIVSLAPNMTEVLFALGAGPRTVGVTRFCDHPPEARALPRVGGFLDPSLEAVVALRPDLVLGVPNASNRTVLERLGELRIPVLLVEAHRLEDVYSLLLEVGRAVGALPAAKEVVARMRARVERVAKAVQGAPRTRVLCAYGRDPLIVAGPRSYTDELLALAGAENIAREGLTRYPTYSMERVLVLAPEVLIDASMEGAPSAGRPSAQALRERWGRFASLPAVKKGRLHWIDPQLVARPGPRLVDALEEIARILHPARFPPP
jgi:iron complex transport system substrate-binding protein